MTEHFDLWGEQAHPPEDLPGQLEQLMHSCRKRGVDYADARFVLLRSEVYETKNGVVSRAAIDAQRGIGLRVLSGGNWGFAASPGSQIDDHSLIGRALDMASAASLTPSPTVPLRARSSETGTYRSPCTTDPRAVSPQKKIDHLLHADEAMAGVGKVLDRKGKLEFYYLDKWYVDTEGTETHQHITESGGGITALAVGEGDAQLRAYPALMGNARQAGWEFIQDMDLPGNAARTAGEAKALLTAPECPVGEFDVILVGSLLALQVHESCGHPSELDRVMGVEADVAGTSFLTPELLGSRRYGSPCVTLTADATVPGGLGTFGWDDEGTPAQRITLVDEGIHSGYLT